MTSHVWNVSRANEIEIRMRLLAIKPVALWLKYSLALLKVSSFRSFIPFQACVALTFCRPLRIIDSEGLVVLMCCGILINALPQMGFLKGGDPQFLPQVTSKHSGWLDNDPL